MVKCTKIFPKKVFLNNLVLLLSATGKVLNSFKSILFPIKNSDKIPTREPTPKSATEKELAKGPEIEPEKATEPTKSTKEKLNAKYLH